RRDQRRSLRARGRHAALRARAQRRPGARRRARGDRAAPARGAGMNEAREIGLKSARGTLAALRWTSPSEGAPVRVLALHGWLDNAASFAPLAPHLPGLDLVALDLP